MVNADMFEGAFPVRRIKDSVNGITNPPNVNQPMPKQEFASRQSPVQPPLDPDMEKWRKFLFKLLVILVGGSAVILIIIRVIQKIL